jgi:hypothetical protein
MSYVASARSPRMAVMRRTLNCILMELARGWLDGKKEELGDV